MPVVADAAPRSVEGHVVDARSHWTSDGSRIVTQATVRTAAGDVVVSQLGGTVDGLTMRTFPGPEIMVVGMQVALAADERLDLSQRGHLVVDHVRVLELPPGFVRTGPTERGNYLFWESGCVFVTADAPGTNQVLGDNEFDAIDTAIAEWNTATSSCSYLDLVQTVPVASEVGRDSRNLIKFRDQSWCRPALGDDPARCYAPNAAGLTTAVFVDDPDSSRDGAIVDADIELNGVDFAITHQGETSGRAMCQSEILNTLTHELGHLLGLEHPCLAGGDPPRIDGEGNEVPLCSETSDPTITEATMYNFQECGETKKASVSADDSAAICAIYPKIDDPGVCEPVGDESGCCSASDSGMPPVALLGGVMAILLLRRRKKSRPA
jgi:MYXO-CTERM domain-containing protein